MVVISGSDTIFNDLVSGDYWILLSNGDTSCIYLLPDKYNLFAKNAPRIIGIDLQNNGDCKDGHTTMTNQASGEHLKFSIDGGIVWKSAFSFFDLADGNYHVQVLDTISFCRSADTTVNINNSIPDLHGFISSRMRSIYLQLPHRRGPGLLWLPRQYAGTR